MTPERWRQIRDVLEEAQELEPTQRSAFLDCACSSDQSLRQEVEVLLASSDDAPSSFLHSAPPADELIAILDGISGPALQAGALFAERFQLVRKLGEGGMGQVWLADQTSPVRRQVALKLIKAGMYDEAVVHRFQAERQSLAIMDHPAIAKVFDAGTTPQGQPYFVMEYVPGLPITECCDGNRDSSTATAEARGTEPKQLVSLLRGDLDWITMKALEKDRTRRYGAPSELAADIGRYLNHEAILARPASAGYRLRKYARRHRVAVGVVAGLVLLLAAFSVLQALQLRRITRERDRANQERDRANRERDRATRITDFMTGMFKVSDPNQARGNSVTAREILDKASNDMGAGLAKDPEVQSQMMQVMATTYSNLGLYGRAHEMAKSALDDRLSLHGPDDPKTLESMAQLGSILLREGQYPEAEKLERQALAGERRTHGTEPWLTVETMYYLAYVQLKQGRYDDAEKLLREAIEAGTRKLGSEDRQVLTARNLLGMALLDQARYVEAEQDYRPVVDVDRRVFGSDDPRTLTTIGNLALAVASQGRFAEAESLYREVLAAQQRVLGPGNAATAFTMENLADLLTREGRPVDAEKLSREALAIRLRLHGPEHPDTLVSKINLSDELFREGNSHQAEKLQREALATQIRVLGPEDPNGLVCRTYLARTLIREEHYAEAEKISREAYDIQLRILGPQHPDTLDSLRELGRALAYSHHYAEASKLFRNAIDQQGHAAARENPWGVWYDFACVAETANRPDDALRYLQQAINLGYKNADGLMADDDLKELRPNPKFQQLVAGLKAPSQKSSAQ
jgi:non-specific serine/threonine protein kinase/serine/threonine-protein kinase